MSFILTVSWSFDLYLLQSADSWSVLMTHQIGENIIMGYVENMRLMTIEHNNEQSIPANCLRSRTVFSSWKWNWWNTPFLLLTIDVIYSAWVRYRLRNSIKERTLINRCYSVWTNDHLSCLIWPKHSQRAGATIPGMGHLRCISSAWEGICCRAFAPLSS